MHNRLRVIQNGAHMNAKLEPRAPEALLGKLERAIIKASSKRRWRHDRFAGLVSDKPRQ